ncbi:helix-turn-helix domain-containing protein [Clostridium sp. DL1XJH146]
MARVTKAMLEEKVEQLQELVNSQMNQIMQLQQEKEDILNNKDCVSKAEFEGVIHELERVRISCETISGLHEKDKEKIIQLDKKVKAYKEGHNAFIKNIELNTEQKKILDKRISFLEKKCEELTEENEKMRIVNKSLINKKTEKIHNARGAGRKSNLTQEQLQKVYELHKQGMSYSKIGEEVGISKAYVCKLIKKQK